VGKLDLYHEYRDQMKTGDLLQFSGRGLISKIIQWKTGGKWSHSSIIIRFEEYDRLMTFTAEPNGFMPILLSRYLREYDGECWWFPLKDELDAGRLEVGKKALDMSGKPYDYTSLFKQLIGDVSTNMSSLFCSEACYLAYGYCGVAPNPNNILNMSLFKEGSKLL